MPDTHPGWPPDVVPVSLNDVDRFGINPRNELFWDGKRVFTRNQVRLSVFQAVLAVLATIATIIGGVNNAATFLCARNIDWLTCPASAPPTVPAAKPAANG